MKCTVILEAFASWMPLLLIVVLLSTKILYFSSLEKRKHGALESEKDNYRNPCTRLFFAINEISTVAAN